jgi:hypothetical protein
MTQRTRIQLQQITLLPAPPTGTADSPTAAFQVLAISAGKGNGWHFTSDALQRSLVCWDGVDCFIDHAQTPQRNSRSIRDLAGRFHHPVWDATQQGIRLDLELLGPSAPLLRQLGREWLSSSPSRPDLGFSADLSFIAQDKEVREILQIHSLDLVMHPARGGQFIQLNQSPQGETLQMKDETIQVETETTPEPIRTRLAAEPSPAMHELLLDSTLQAANLPEAISKRIRTRFQQHEYDPSELTLAVEDGRKLAAELLGKTSVAGLSRVTQMVDTRDQLQAACDDLLGAPRESGMQQVHPARLSGIRELYLTLTGDTDLHGGYYPERARLATTADFNGLVKNSLNKVVANRWEELGQAGYDWWQKIATVEHFNTLNQITGALVGTVGSLPEVTEGAAYTELVVGDSPEVADWKKYGGYIPLTLELIDRDETRKLRAYPRELASAGLRKISALVAALFTANAGIGPTLADTGALFNNTAVTTAGGHKNLLVSALSAAEWETVSTAVFNQPLLIKNSAGVYGTGPRSGVNPRYLLVPRQLQLTGMKILYPTLENAASIYSQNQQRGQPGDVITVPEWTDANDWAAVVNPRIAPAVFIGERFGLMPEIFIAGDDLSPTVFSNDEHRLKVRHFLAVWVNDFRPLHKSNVP